MSLRELLTTPLRRLNPHRGMIVDVEKWSVAHEYHRAQRRLHALSMHRPGVAVGLDVVAWNPPDNSVVIHPGAASDADGNLILVGEPLRIPLKTDESGVAYLILRHREIPEHDADGVEDTVPASYVVEGYTLEERRSLPEETYVELARVVISGTGASVTEPSSNFEPRPDQIDRRFRPISGPRAEGRVSVGLLGGVTGDASARHQAGAAALVQAINYTTSFLAEFQGQVSPEEGAKACNLLLITGNDEFNVSDPEVQALKDFLQSGGVLFGESCAYDGSGHHAQADAFVTSFIELAEQLGSDLSTVTHTHPLLSAYHVFGQTPSGQSETTRVTEGNGVIFSTGDYGCLWVGGGDDLASREVIRAATEMGVNLGIYACDRSHTRAVVLSNG